MAEQNVVERSVRRRDALMASVKSCGMASRRLVPLRHAAAVWASALPHLAPHRESVAILAEARAAAQADGRAAAVATAFDGQAGWRVHSPPLTSVGRKNRDLSASPSPAERERFLAARVKGPWSRPVAERTGAMVAAQHIRSWIAMARSAESVGRVVAGRIQPGPICESKPAPRRSRAPRCGYRVPAARVRVDEAPANRLQCRRDEALQAATDAWTVAQVAVRVRLLRHPKSAEIARLAPLRW